MSDINLSLSEGGQESPRETQGKRDKQQKEKQDGHGAAAHYFIFLPQGAF